MQITFVKGSRAADRRVYCAYLESDVRRIQTWANIPFWRWSNGKSHQYQNHHQPGKYKNKPSSTV